MTRPSPLTMVLVEVAARLGFRVVLDPDYPDAGQIIAPDGRSTFFVEAYHDLNTSGAAVTTKYKNVAANVMHRLGYPVPEGRAFYARERCARSGIQDDSEAALRYARTLGFPVFVKPNAGSKGAGVALVHDERELRHALSVVFDDLGEPVALVQRPAPGEHYRLVVIDDEVVVAVRCTPLAVVGDGRSTLAELLARKREELAARGHAATLDPHDFRLRMRLERLRMSLDGVPRASERIALQAHTNMSAGGEAVDVLAQVHSGYRTIAVRLTRDLGLRYSAIDLATPAPIDEPPGAYTIIEINSAPGLNPVIVPAMHKRRALERYYEKLLRALLP